MLRRFNRLTIYFAICSMIACLFTSLCGCDSGDYQWTVTQGKIIIENKLNGGSISINTPVEGFDGSVDYSENSSEEEVEKEKVDLFFFMGQSNMAGHGGNKDEAPAVSEEAGMEYRVISDPEKLYPIEEPFGANENKEGGLFDKDNKKLGSLVSSFINRYHELTGKKVIGVSGSVGGMAMDLWLNDGIIDDAVSRINDSVSYLEENNFEIEHVYVLWLQGESDGARNVDPEVYKEEFYQFMDKILETSVERVFLITPGKIYYNPDAYSGIIKIQKEICEQDDNFVLATSILSDIDVSMMSDAYHYNQEALNMVGESAAEGVAEYAYGVKPEEESAGNSGENDPDIREDSEEDIPEEFVEDNTDSDSDNGDGINKADEGETVNNQE